jgi:hypothetical protein
MAAVSPISSAALREEGMYFWERLINECREQTRAINSALSNHGRTAVDHVECLAGDCLNLIKSHCPSTTVKVNIVFEGWGPVLKIAITGHQRPDFGFYPEEMEVQLAREVDGGLVAVFDEGRSLSPRELASYLTQHFRRCFPYIALPCSEIALT